MFRHEKNMTLPSAFSVLQIWLSWSISVVKIELRELFGFVLSKITRRRMFMGDIIAMDYRNHFK